jgi:hypothetical protein
MASMLRDAPRLLMSIGSEIKRMDQGSPCKMYELDINGMMAELKAGQAVPC